MISALRIRLSILVASLFAVALQGQTDDYFRAVMALKPDHYYRLDEPAVGPVLLDGADNPVPVREAGGYQYDSPVEDMGFATLKLEGFHEGRFLPEFDVEPLAVVGVGAVGPFGCGIEDSNLVFAANNAGSVNLGPNDDFAHDVMTVACWFLARGSEGGDRIFTNNRFDRSDHFQITLGGSANLVIGIDPNSETVADSLQVPDSALPVKDGVWHHIVASRNGPTMANVRVVIDGIDFTSALVDSTTGWGRTGDDAHIASRPGGDGGANGQTLNGMVDEVAIWLGRQLTSAESQDLYNAGLGCLPPATVTRVPVNDPHVFNDKVEVTLVVKANAPNTAVVIRELLPPAVTVVEISDAGSEVDGVITWELPSVLEKTLRYKLDAGPCAGDLFYGVSTLQVGESKQSVSGPTRLSILQTNPDLGPWESVSIGAVGGVAEVVSAQDLFVSAPGFGIRLSRDEFHFVHVPVTGDFELSARIDCASDLAQLGQAGLMVRDTLDVFAANVFFGLSLTPPPEGGFGQLRGAVRRETLATRLAGTIALSDSAVAGLPIYLRLRRAAGKILLERSADGASYTEVGSREIGVGSTQVKLGDTVMIGLAATASSPSSGKKAQFIFREVSGPSFLPNLKPEFHRGDADGNSKLELTDAVRILGFLFLGAAAPACLNAADSDDNGEIQLTDAVRILGFLFLGGPPPLDPGPPGNECGSDPDAGADLGCIEYGGC